jgi:hypothetical protein
MNRLLTSNLIAISKMETCELPLCPITLGAGFTRFQPLTVRYRKQKAETKKAQQHPELQQSPCQNPVNVASFSTSQANPATDTVSLKTSFAPGNAHVLPRSFSPLHTGPVMRGTPRGQLPKVQLHRSSGGLDSMLSAGQRPPRMPDDDGGRLARR